MALTPGARLGQYEVIAQIGAGGMGEVYRARDTKLHRDVALKILADALANDEEHLARFRREAYVLAALNHPHIAHVYGLEDSGGLVALVMELVEGPTLAELIAASAPGGLPFDDAIAIVRQIADALETAHEQGIVHRDLKPANVKVRTDGTVKVLDFGLAKPVAPSTPSRDVANSPTVTSPAMTERGIILGTAAYMAPEQARGRPVDKRADIWAFGVVLYEMLTGKRPFAGDDLTETIALVVKGEVDYGPVPRAARRLIVKCLEKDPKRRLRDIGDAFEFLDKTPAPADTPVARRPRTLWFWLAGLGIVGVAAVAAAWFGQGRAVPPPAPVTRVVVSLPPERSMPADAGLGAALEVSPDGRTIVYRAIEHGEFRLYRRFLDQLDAVPIGEVDGVAPFFSPDGQSVGFLVGPTLKRVPVQGGAASTIVQLPDWINLGASWNADDSILLGGNTLRRISPNGRDIETLATLPDRRRFRYPRLLPGGRAILYTIGSPNQTEEIQVFDLATHQLKPLLAGSAARYVRTGHLILVRDTALWAVPFDLGRLDVTGSPVRVLDGLRVEPAGAYVAGTPQLAVSETGTLVYMPGIVNQLRTLVWIDHQGRETPLGTEPRAYANPRISPDGARIAVTMRDGGQDVWIYDVARRALRALTSDAAPNFIATWFPDSRRLAFSAQVNGINQVHTQAADGSGVMQALTEGPANVLPFDVARDGSLLFAQYNGTVTDIGLLPAGDPKQRRLLLQTPNMKRNPAVSPDGRWLAYETNRTGRYEIYVRPFPAVEGGEFSVTSEGGIAPMWAPNGRELFYWTERAGIASVMAVPVIAGPTFAWGPRRVAAQGPFAHPSWDRQYDVAADGRLLVMKTVVTPPPNEIVVVTNWFEELKRLVPVP